MPHRIDPTIDALEHGIPSPEAALGVIGPSPQGGPPNIRLTEPTSEANVAQRVVFYELESREFRGQKLTDVLGIKSPNEINLDQVPESVRREAKRWEELIDLGFEFLLNKTQNVKDLRDITSGVDASDEKIQRIVNQLPEENIGETIGKLAKASFTEVRPKIEAIGEGVAAEIRARKANEAFIKNIEAFLKQQLELQKAQQEATLKAQEEANRFFKTGQINFKPFRTALPNLPSLAPMFSPVGHPLPVGQVGGFNFLA